MRKTLKKYLPDKKRMENSLKLGKLRNYLHSAFLWRVDRGTVSCAVAAGLFTAAVPILPFQTLLVIVLSILLRANLPIAFAVSWVSNPLTIFPIAYVTYLVGDQLLGKTQTAIAFQDIHWQYGSAHELWVSFTTWMSQFGNAFFVGLPVVAISAALAGYLLVNICWYGVVMVRRYSSKGSKNKK